MNEEQENRFVVVWSAGDGNLRTLTYRPEGTVRTYNRDAIDPRAKVDLITEDWSEMLVALNDKKYVAIPVRLAKRFGPDWRFA